MSDNDMGVAGIEKQDLEGPKIDRRTTIKLLGAGGFTGLATSLAERAEAGKQDEQAGYDDLEGQQSGGEIAAGILGDTVNFLDPHRVGSSREIRVHANIFNGLVKVNPDAEIVGEVAQDWSLPDETTYVFELVEGATFHNGDPLDAQAAKWSFERLLDFEESQHRGKLESVTEIEADGNELTINLDQPQAPFITFMTGGLGRAGAIVHESAEDDRQAYNRMPVGSGPFEITDRSDGESITLEKFDEYWETDENGNQLPYLDRIELELIPEPSTMWSAVRSGEIDITHEITGQFGRQAREIPELEVDSASTGQWTAMRLMTSNPADNPEYARAATRGELDPVPDLGDAVPTANEKVRRAVAMAIDREQLVETGFFGFAEPAHQLYNPVTFMHKENPEPGHYYDPERAQELLDETEYTGEPRFQAELVSLPVYERMATVLQEQLSDVGIDVTVSLLEPSIYWGSDGIRGFDTLFGIARGSGDIDPWMAHWRQFGHTNEVSGKGNSTFGAEKFNLWHDEEFDDLIIEDVQTPDQDRRRELLSRAMEIFIEQSPVAMLVFPTPPVIRAQRLQNVAIPAGLRDYSRAYLSE